MHGLVNKMRKVHNWNHCSIPFKYRAAKRIQRVSLKRYFAESYKIPYCNTGLDLRVPFVSHKAVFHAREKLEVLA
jgi:hypothetical protein